MLPASTASGMLEMSAPMIKPPSKAGVTGLGTGSTRPPPAPGVSEGGSEGAPAMPPSGGSPSFGEGTHGATGLASVASGSLPPEGKPGLISLSAPGADTAESLLEQARPSPLATSTAVAKAPHGSNEKMDVRRLIWKG